MISFLLYNIPYLGYSPDKNMFKAMTLFTFMALIYYIPVLIYLTSYTDCFDFAVNTDIIYRRRDPKVFLGLIPFLILVLIYYLINKSSMLNKFSEFELDSIEETLTKMRPGLRIFVLVTIFYLLSSFFILDNHYIPSINNCLEYLK